MAYTPKDGSGALFKNDKGDNPARPDYKGDIMLGGVLYEVSGWIKSLPSDASKSFMSLSGKPKQERESRTPGRVTQGTAKPSSGFDDFEDAPF